MAFGDSAPEPSQVPDEGVWVTRLPSLHQRPVFRVSVSTTGGKHYDLLLMLADDLSHDRVLQTSQWIKAITVITSYSIHYTKLYEQDLQRKPEALQEGLERQL